MTKPLVAIPVPHSEKPEYNRRTLPQYLQALDMAGLTAMMISPESSPEEAARLVSGCQGVLLPGSPADVDPQKYGAERERACNPPDARRDTIDELLLQDAHNMHKPVFAICYGLQSLNVWRTGSLIQDIRTSINHETGRDVAMAHEVEIEPDSILGKTLTGAKEITRSGKRMLLPVNSSHHQSALAVGDGLRVVAWCPQDGIVEGIEGTSPDHWVTAVQWHPEKSSDEASALLFAAFAKAVRNWKPRSITESVG